MIPVKIYTYVLDQFGEFHLIVVHPDYQKRYVLLLSLRRNDCLQTLIIAEFQPHSSAQAGIARTFRTISANP